MNRVLIEQVAKLLYTEVPTPLSITLRQGLPSEMAPDPVENRHTYESPMTFALDLGIRSYLKKYADGGDPKARAEGARSLFISCEEQCRRTNRRFEQLWAGDEKVFRPATHAILHSAARKIAMVLGECQPDEILRLGRWGNGATAGLTRRKARFDVKQSHLPLDCTYAAAPLLWRCIEKDPHWFEAMTGHVADADFSILTGACMNYVRSNVVMTVPKDSRKDRLIAKEPTGNGWLQQAVGRFLRRRMKMHGIDLSNGWRTNRVRAEGAYSHGGIATLDLSNASDTIARNLVQELLPFDWYSLLSTLRSPSGDIGFLFGDGERGTHLAKYEKFSSMGNAFTFELESLIFWAVSTAATELNSIVHGKRAGVSVFGDDIVCDSLVAVDELIPVLEDIGFTVNMEKSFTDGPFFESCGGQYFKGYTVNPPYQKAVLGNELDAVRAANRLMRWLGDVLLPQFWDAESGTLRDDGFRDSVRPRDVAGMTRCYPIIGNAWWRIVESFPRLLKVRGPYNSGTKLRDDYLVDLAPDLNPDARDTQYGRWQPCLVPTVVKRRRHQMGALSYWLRRADQGPVPKLELHERTNPETGMIFWEAAVAFDEDGEPIDWARFATEPSEPVRVRRRFIWA